MSTNQLNNNGFARLSADLPRLRGAVPFSDFRSLSIANWHPNWHLNSASKSPYRDGKDLDRPEIGLPRGLACPQPQIVL